MRKLKFQAKCEKTKISTSSSSTSKISISSPLIYSLFEASAACIKESVPASLTLHSLKGKLSDCVVKGEAAKSWKARHDATCKLLPTISGDVNFSLRPPSPAGEALGEVWPGWQKLLFSACRQTEQPNKRRVESLHYIIPLDSQLSHILLVSYFYPIIKIFFVDPLK